jgi:hypothetical protein
MAFGTILWLVSGKKIGLRERIIITAEQISPALSGIIRFIRKIFFFFVMTEILRNRIKPLLFIVFIFLIAYVILWCFALKGGKVNYFYNGLGQIDMAIIWFLLGIENLRKQDNKAKKFSILWFVFSLVGFFWGYRTCFFNKTINV